MKKNIALVLKVLLLTLILIVTMALSSRIVSVRTSSQAPSNSLTPILVYAFINTIALTMFIYNSKLRGFKLIGKTFIIFWGVQYFMTQIETLYFNAAVKMPLEELVRMVVFGAINAIVFSILAVLILGKFKKDQLPKDSNATLNFKKSAPHILLLSLCYVVVYFLFGYFVAWQFADLRYYYTGSKDILNLFVHLINQFKTDPILPLFQLIRGVIWSGLAMLIINSLGTVKWKTYFITGFLFSILITSPLIFENAYMPAQVRLGHSFELFSSMFAFGLLSVYILTQNLILNSKAVKSHTN